MYGLCLITALLFCGTLVCLRLKRERRDVFSFIAILALIYLGVITGAYILYLIATYGIPNVIRDIREGTWAFLRTGGLVFYGGLIGGIGMAFVGAMITGVRLRDYVNAAVPAIPLAHAIGRIGCTCAGCCFGFDYDGPLHIFSEQRDMLTQGLAEGQHIGTFPVQPLESAINLVLAFVLWRLSKRMKEGSWTLLFIYLIAYGVERFLLEFLRGDVVRGGFGGLSTSQWISMAIVTFSAIMLITGNEKKQTETP